MADPKELLDHPNNYRIHTEQQRETLNGVLQEVGWVRDILVNKRNGRIIDGHLRVDMAKRVALEIGRQVFGIEYDQSVDNRLKRAIQA